jgi:hypothetical protein
VPNTVDDDNGVLHLEQYPVIPDAESVFGREVGQSFDIAGGLNAMS